MVGKTTIPAYILCGGKSSRMGQDKGLVTLEERPLISYVISTLKEITNSIFLVTQNTEYESFNLPTVADIYKSKGPLGGIHSALNHTNSERILVLSCDIPFINKETLNTLLNSNNTSEIIFASSEERWHPLIGLYSISLLPNLERTLQENRLKLIDFIKSQTYKEVKIAQVRALTNVNTPEALAQLQKH